MSQDFKKLDWNPDTNMPVGKGATTQRFMRADHLRLILTPGVKLI